jgi:hypothetical protein
MNELVIAEQPRQCLGDSAAMQISGVQLQSAQRIFTCYPDFGLVG